MARRWPKMTDFRPRIGSTASHAAFFVFFLRRWTAGHELAVAVRDANRRADLFFLRASSLGPGVRGARGRWAKSRAEIHGARQGSIAGGIR